MKKALISSILLLVISVLIGIAIYPKMPQEMASHWNALGQADGYMPKFWGIAILPIIYAIVILLLVFLPAIDPLKKNIAKFKSYYDLFILMMSAFLFYLYILTLIWNLGYRFNMTLMLIPSFALLFYYTGMLLEHSKRNWFIGIKTPWTLSSDKVWDKTHKQGAILFKITGAITLLGMLFPRYSIAFVIVPVITVSIWLFVYSYIVFKKTKK